MEEKDPKIKNLQTKSHEALMKVLNNIGIIGTILTSIADIIIVLIFVLGVSIKQDMHSTILFAVINAIVGLMITFLLRYQGQKYAEIENQELLDKFNRNKVKKEKKHLNMFQWNTLMIIKDIITKGCTAAFSIYGIIYISIQGSKNVVQILFAIVTLVLFICFGLIAMNGSYCRYYNVQVPYMELKLKEEEENGSV